MKQVSRASGRSAVASAAYRSATKLTNERDGLMHDYTRKDGVVQCEIVLPENSTAEWAKDRSTLWNAAERAEKRVDARVAREYEIALPHELSAEQRSVLARDFAQCVADRYGVAVDVAIHAPHVASDVRNHHAHLLATTRQVGEAGLGEKAYCERENRWLLANELPTTTMQLIDLRHSWEQVANTHLARAGLEIRIDHRSHRERGLEIAPTEHMGVHATQMQRRGLAVTRSRLDDDGAQRNAVLLREKPEQVLALITAEQSVFDRHDVARALHRALGNDAAAFRNAFATVMASPALVELQGERRDPESGEATLARYSTWEMVALEAGMAGSAERLHASREHGVERRYVEAAMARQDAALRRGAGDATAGLSEEQRQAIEHITGRQQIAAVVGFAGAGKSTMLAAVREAWVAQGYRVHGAALSGKAAEGLEDSSGIASRTLASWERGWERERGLLGPGDVLVIDEAGMVGSRQLARFVTEAEARGAKLVLVGDHEQLQAIGAGAPFRAIAERVGHAALTDIRRQRQDWQREASVAFATHRTAEGLAAYRERGAIRFSADSAAACQAVVADYLADRQARPQGSRVAMAHRRADVRALNTAIRETLQQQGQLAQGEAAGERSFQTNDGERQFAPGDRIVFLENNRDLGVKNGLLGTVQAVEAGRLLVSLDGRDGQTVSVAMGDYRAIDHGYATTIHKNQGATVDRAFVLASGSMDRHLTYVAMTRHRDEVRLYASQEEFGGRQDGPPTAEAEALAYARLEGRLARSGAKQSTLDYAGDFAERRGIAAAFGVSSEIAVLRPEVGAGQGLGEGAGPGWKQQSLRPQPALQHNPDAKANLKPDRAAAPIAEKPRRGMFEGLKLGSGRGASAGATEVTGRSAPMPDPLAERARSLSPFEQAVDGYAQAHGVVERQHRAGLPLLEGQRQALRAAGEQLDQARAGSQELLRAALQHDPRAAQAMVELSGRARVGQLMSGLERERAAQADPAVRAERFVARWQALDGQRQQLRGWQHDAPRGEVEARMRGLAQSLEQDLQAAAVLRGRRQELGIGAQGRQGEGIAQALQRSLAPGRSQSLGRGM